MKVGLLDSGIGGWSFLSKIEEAFPQNEYLYFADQKNCPYGNKSLTELKIIVDEWINIINTKDIDVLILACNTLTAWFKDRFEKELRIPVLGTTDGLETQRFGERNIVLLATIKTIQSQWYQNLFPNVNITQIGNTWLANTIEKRFALTHTELLKLKAEVESKAGTDWNEMILGCTHYPLITHQLKTIWPDKIFVNPADTIIKELETLLQTKKLGTGNIIMYTTGEKEILKEQLNLFFTEKKHYKIKISKLGKKRGTEQFKMS